MVERIVLSATENERLQRAFNKAARWAYSTKKNEITPDDLADKNVRPLMRELNNVLQEAISIPHEVPDRMLRHLQESVYVFSGGKTFAELRELGGLLLDEEGKTKPFSKFFAEVRQVHETYNKNYLESEYLFATQSARMAGKWAEVEQDGDDYNLQYRTASDDRVRPEHMILHDTTLPPSDPFWRSYFPPNGWRCRCTAVQVRRERYPVSDSTEAMERGAKATYTEGRGGVNTSAMFRFNPGIERVIFPSHHPYLKDGAVVEAVKKMREADVPAAGINLKEHIKGNNATSAEVNTILMKYAELRPADFAGGLEEVKVLKAQGYFMMHSRGAYAGTKQWATGSTIKLSSHDFGPFNPARELKAALGAIKRGEALTFHQEYAVESLWHEILHAKTGSAPFKLSTVAVREMETVNQFCARHTYDGFLEFLGGKASHKAAILDEGLGYKTHVAQFRNLLKTAGIDEALAAEELMPALMSNYSTVGKEIGNLFKKYKK